MLSEVERPGGDCMKQTSILVVEDDEIVARTIERCLRGGEFRVRLANSGVEGLRVARREVPNLVILDVIMPGMDGYAVCREMRSDPVLSEVPILFLTAKTKDEDKIIGFTAGADDYLGKPFNVDELILRIRAILRRTQRMQNQNRAENEPQPVRESESPVPDPFSQTERIITVGDYSLNTRSYEFTGPKS